MVGSARIEMLDLTIAGWFFVVDFFTRAQKSFFAKAKGGIRGITGVAQ